MMCHVKHELRPTFAKLISNGDFVTTVRKQADEPLERQYDFDGIAILAPLS